MRTILAASAIFVAVLLGCLNASGNSQDKSPQAAKGAPLQITTPDKVESRIGPLAFTDGIPTENTAEKVYDHLDYIRGVNTFLNSFSGVSMYSIRKGFRGAGVADNSVLIFSELMDSKSLFLTANCDTVYFWGYLDLSKGPMVVEVPAGSLGVFNDMWFRWIADFGTPGADRGEGGKYLLLPPGYAGPVPGGGFYVGRSRTNGAALIGRAFLEKDDPRPVAEHIKKNLKIYPYAPGGQGTSIADFLQGKAKLGPPATPTPAKFVEGSGRAMNTIPPNDVTFYDVLNALVQEEPASALEPELAGQFAAIGIIKGKPFQPDARLKKILVEALAMGNAASRVIGTRARPEEGFQYYGKESAWSNPLFAGGSEFKTPPPLVTKEGIKPFP
ncbi:MAG TPA: DUF1254 domain-containing protein, partial [Planctomycetaceae bacterium]|nr:DUF1254 domain-containing protein [Planctomycetaceae bacterium]